MTKSALYGSTDYPFEELGDQPFKHAPRRNVKVIAYDFNKYVTVEVYGGKGISITTQIKSGYVRRYDWKKKNNDWFSHKELSCLPAIEY